MKRFKLVSTVVALTLLWAAHDSIAQSYQHPGTALLFHDRLTGVEKGKVTNFEVENPGLGVGVGYNAPGITVTIYVYTMEMKSVPSDLAAPVLKRQFAQAMGDVIRAGEIGRYDNVKKNSEGEVLFWALYRRTESAFCDI